jgi:Ubiquitin carboxyl-terminal hydrolase
MADVAMGQTLNTVTCPVCNYSSRNFDPFNLLSIPIPSVADVIFHCLVFRRATAKNCPGVLNRARKSDREKRSARYSGNFPAVTGPPSDTFVSEQYVIALSRLADGGDLRLQLQNLCGIRANNLRLCRAEEFIVNKEEDDNSILKTHVRVTLLADKDGPASQNAKKRAPNEEGLTTPTYIVAFETTLNDRRMAENDKDEDTDEDSGDEVYPTRTERMEIEKYLRVYGDDKECRLVDTDPQVIAKAVSRSLWPRSESDLKVGLRVDAKDHRGNWFPGSIVEIFDDEVNGGDADTGQEVTLRQRKVRVHFDNFLPKWDEEYTIESFRKGRVNPLYSHAEPKPKPTEFLVHNRFFDRERGTTSLFGQSFYVQCKTEWSNARAGAHILAQVARFLFPGSDKTLFVISDLMDLLIDCDREYVRLALGVSKHNTDDEKARPYRNSKFDGAAFVAATNKKVFAFLSRLPFEVLLCSVDKDNAGKPVKYSEEVSFPYHLDVTIGNFVSIRNSVVIQWRESALPQRVFYCNPKVEVHELSAELLNHIEVQNGKKMKAVNGGMDLGFCLTEFCKVQKLPLSDNWKCPRCKVIREGGQYMNLWRLPDLLTFHIKRFNMSARWHEKVTTRVNFPMTGLDMSQWCHKESPVFSQDPDDSHVYDLIGVMNHYGSMTGGHYVSTCKATLCGREGREEVAYNFNGFGTSTVEIEESEEPSGWTLGRSKPKVNYSKVDAAAATKAVSESAEPMWLQFDDEVVEAIPPRHVVSEMAYVLFYRRRRITPSNIAKYSTLE